MPKGGEKKKHKDSVGNSSDVVDTSSEVKGDHTQSVSSNQLDILITSVNGLTDHIKTMRMELTQIKEDVRSLKELKSKVDAIKKTADTACDNSENNTEEIDILKCQLFSANNSIKALQATCSSLHDYIVQQDMIDTYSCRENFYWILFLKLKVRTMLQCYEKYLWIV